MRPSPLRCSTDSGRFPSVFHEWFLETFPEPSAWLRARLAYARTAAVISIVGFVLGLGDRHCENILLEGNTGDTVHVDFNCLFDKVRPAACGEDLPCARWRDEN